MFEDLLESLACEGQLVHLEHEPARPSRMGLVVDPMSDEVWKRLGIDALWCHQAEAINLLGDGQSVVVATGTASGKSLFYQAAIAEAVAGDDLATALMIFPTKALAQDQLRSLAAPGFPGLVASTYDGDTEPASPHLGAPQRQRRADEPRDAPRGHPAVPRAVGELPAAACGTSSSTSCTCLRGIFGTHAAHVLRRLRRVCAALRRRIPTFVFSSATVGEPGRSGRRRCAACRCARSWTTARHAASACSRCGTRRCSTSTPAPGRSPTSRRRALTAAFVEGGWRTVTFCRSRRATEVVPADVRRTLDADLAEPHPLLPGRLPAQRAARDRGRAVRRAARRRRGHERARARHRRRWARRLHPQRLPRHDRVDVAAGRAGRARRAAVGGRARGRDRPARPMAHGPSPRGVHPSARAGGRQPLEPVRAAAAPRLRRVRGAAVACDDEPWWGDDLADGVRQLVLGDRLGCATARAYWQRAGHAGARHRPALGLAGRVPHRRRRRTAGRHRRRQPRVRAGAPGRDLPAPGSAVPRRVARPRRPRRDRRASRRRRVHAGPQPRRRCTILRDRGDAPDRPSRSCSSVPVRDRDPGRRL